MEIGLNHCTCLCLYRLTPKGKPRKWLMWGLPGAGGQGGADTLQGTFSYHFWFCLVLICLSVLCCVPTLWDPTRLFCPWDFPGKKTGVACHFLLQGIFPTQGPNPRFLHLLHCRWILYPWAIGEACHTLCLHYVLKLRKNCCAFSCWGSRGRWRSLCVGLGWRSVL